MRLALDEAQKAANVKEVPVGACLVLDGDVVARGHNQMREQGDPTAHAEMLVMERGRVILAQKKLDGCDLYITLEPCTMCAGAISLNHIRRLYYGAEDKKMGNCEFFFSPLCHHSPEIYNAIGERAAQSLIQNFFCRLRENNL